MIYDVVHQSIRPLLNPELTASWEKGLTYVAEGSITSEEYMGKLENFVTRHTVNVKQMRNQFQLKSSFDASAPYYKKPLPRAPVPGNVPLQKTPLQSPIPPPEKGHTELLKCGKINRN